MTRPARGPSRRAFLRSAAAAGAGLVVAIDLTGCAAEPLPAPEGVAFAPGPWIRIGTDGTVRVVGDRSEMGQGITTGYAVLVAEELDIDPARIAYEFAPAHEAYYNRAVRIAQMTGGSTGMVAAFGPVREAAARARAMLVAAAAARWGVPVAECGTEDGTVRHPSGRSATYGELAAAAAARPVPREVALRPRERWRWIGAAGGPRVDAPAHVRGASVFGVDARPRGALVAVLARPPVVAGGRLVRHDPAAALAVPGVRHVVPVTNGVAVVADATWAALRGRDALVAEWDDGPLGALDSGAQLAEFQRLAREGDGHVVRAVGDVATVPAGTVVRAEAHVPYLAHTCMEPMNATARVTPERCDVWAPTQLQDARLLFGGGARGVAARLTGLPRERVHVHTTHLGGGFGRRAEVDFVVDAVEVSRAVGAAVQVVWTRDDDVRHDWYRPMAASVLEATLGADGLPVRWHHRLACASILEKVLPGWMPDWMKYRAGPGGGLHASAVEGAADLPYTVPHLRVEHVKVETTVPLGWWRSVGHGQNAFFVETFVDELAAAAGADPGEYRLRLLRGRPRHAVVLRLAAERAGWGRRLPAGHAHGIALHESFGSVVAQVAEVSLEGGLPRVHHVTCAADCGQVVVPDQVRAQMEGAIAYGLTAALHGAIAIERGRVRQGNFHDYPALRLVEMPRVAVHLVDAGDAAPGGAGEPGLPPIAPAVANAVRALTGRPVRALPIRAG